MDPLNRSRCHHLRVHIRLIFCVVEFCSDVVIDILYVETSAAYENPRKLGVALTTTNTKRFSTIQGSQILCVEAKNATATMLIFQGTQDALIVGDKDVLETHVDGIKRVICTVQPMEDTALITMLMQGVLISSGVLLQGGCKEKKVWCAGSC